MKTLLGLNPIRLLLVVLVLQLFVPATEGQPKPSFKRLAYSTADGRESITIISSTELEISTGEVASIICRYTREGDVIRAVKTVLGTNQAVYYNVVADGLQDKKGRIFYSPSALARVRGEQAKAEIAKARSRQVTKTLMEVHAWKWAHDSNEIYHLTLTDVNVNYTSNQRASGGLGFYNINRVDLVNCDRRTAHPCELRIEYNDFHTSFGFFFVDDAKRLEFAKAMDRAIRTWRTTYPTVWQRRYYGLKGDTAIAMGVPRNAGSEADTSVPRPRPETQTKASYTEVARKAGIKGTVIVRCSVSEQGDVVATEVIKSLPFGLDAAAVAAVRTWKFRPALENGTPIAATYDAVVAF